MCSCIEAVEHPSTKKNGYNPAVGIGRLFFLTTIDAIIEMAKDLIQRREITGDLDWNPESVEEEQGKEDRRRHPEIPL